MKGSTWWAEEVPEALGDGYADAVLRAIRNGHAVLEWKPIIFGDYEIQAMTRPLAIGTFDDYVALYGVSAELVDLIALELGDVMSPTPWLYDAAATHPDARWVGPHTLPTLPGIRRSESMTKKAAKAHADAVEAECQRLGYPPTVRLSGWGKTYGLRRYRTAPDGSPTIRPRYALEYGWSVREPISWGSPNVSGTGWVVQKPEYAHLYRAFWDYSMAAWYVLAAARHHGRTVDLRDHIVDPHHADALSLSGVVPYVIHPDCPGSSAGLSERIPDTLPSSEIHAPTCDLDEDCTCGGNPWDFGIEPRDYPVGERCLIWLGYQFGSDVREIPGPEHDPRILSYSKHCRRGGAYLGNNGEGKPVWNGGTPLALPTDDAGSPWCAALASETLRAVLLPGEIPPHGLRVSVRELVEDARAAGTLRPADWTPTPGSLAICGRAGEDPLRGGRGHVRAVVGVEGSRYLGIGGNEHDTIACGWHDLRAVEIRAWIER